MTKLPPLARIDARLGYDFAVIWKDCKSDLEKAGLRVGSIVSEGDGSRYRITAIKPSVSHFGAPTARISCTGVKKRADGTWGVHEHNLIFDRLVITQP